MTRCFPGAALACLALSVASTATAADLPRRDKLVNPFLPKIESLPVWTGFYAGALVGFGLGAAKQKDDQDLGTGSFHPEGGLAGIAIGYDRDVGPMVIGIEADIARSGIGGSSPWCGTTPGICGTKAEEIGTARLRLGMPVGETLLYLTGGVATAHAKAWNEANALENWRYHAGYAIGAGFERRLGGAWTLRGEYIYADFGRRTVYDIAAATPVKASLALHMFRAGVNYRFD